MAVGDLEFLNETFMAGMEIELQEEDDHDGMDNYKAEDEVLIAITLITDNSSLPEAVNRFEFRDLKDTLGSKESPKELIADIICDLYIHFPSNFKARNSVIDFMVNYISLLDINWQDCVLFYFVMLNSTCYHIGSTEEEDKFKENNVVLEAYNFMFSDEGKQLRSATDFESEEIELPVYSSVYDFAHNLAGEFDRPPPPEAEIAYSIKFSLI